LQKYRKLYNFRGKGRIMGNLHMTATNDTWFHRTIWFMVRSEQFLLIRLFRKRRDERESSSDSTCSAHKFYTCKFILNRLITNTIVQLTGARKTVSIKSQARSTKVAQRTQLNKLSVNSLPCSQDK